jgi:predicted membrane channel-forming protein YqfA (hemolysin III family)
MTEPADHYPDPAARRADLIVHIIGLAFALLGGATLMALAFGLDPLRAAASVSIYVAGRRFWVGLYLALGWLALVAIKPMIDGVSWTALALLAAGGLVYSTGAAFYLIKKLKFRRAIWHGHVVGASAIHYAAVLIGVVLARGAG